MTDAASACERLELSRQRLRQGLRDSVAPRRAATQSAERGPVARWLDRLKAIPAVSILLDTVRNWWERHPVRVVSIVAAEGAGAVARPIAQRHPLALVAAALLLGVVFAWSRPWRWIVQPALLAGLLPQLLSKALANTSSRSWMALLAALTQMLSSPTKPATRAPAHATSTLP